MSFEDDINIVPSPNGFPRASSVRARYVLWNISSASLNSELLLRQAGDRVANSIRIPEHFFLIIGLPAVTDILRQQVHDDDLRIIAYDLVDAVNIQAQCWSSIIELPHLYLATRDGGGLVTNWYGYKLEQGVLRAFGTQLPGRFINMLKAGQLSFHAFAEKPPSAPVAVRSSIYNKTGAVDFCIANQCFYVRDAENHCWHRVDPTAVGSMSMESQEFELQEFDIRELPTNSSGVLALVEEAGRRMKRDSLGSLARPYVIAREQDLPSASNIKYGTYYSVSATGVLYFCEDFTWMRISPDNRPPKTSTPKSVEQPKPPTKPVKVYSDKRFIRRRKKS